MDGNLILPSLLVLAAVAFVWLLRRWNESRIEPPAEASSPPAEISGDRVLITHPMIRRAAARALERGDEVAQYIVEDDGRLYFSFDRIPDAAARQRAIDIVRRVESGETGSVTDIMWLVRHVFKQ